MNRIVTSVSSCPGRPGQKIAAALTVAALSLSLCSLQSAVVQAVSHADPNIAVGDGASGDSGGSRITPDGRFVLFASTARNLALATNEPTLSADLPGQFNVFLRDRVGNSTRVVSVDETGTLLGNGNSFPLGVSTNGRFALFESDATNLVANDTNGVTDVFLRDMVGNVTILVSAGMGGNSGNGESRSAVLTPDGRFVAFMSRASNLVADDTNGLPDIFVYDRQLGSIQLASAGFTAFKTNENGCYSPAISDDGNYVAFYSITNLGLTGYESSGIFVRDLSGKKTTLASEQAPVLLNSMSSYTNYSVFGHALSADGRFVAFAVSPWNSISPVLILRYDMITGITDLVNTNGLMFFTGRDDATVLDISFDGRSVAFLARTNVNGSPLACVMVWDEQSKASTMISNDLTNGIAAGRFEWPVLDPTGRFVCFNSDAPGMVTNVSNYGVHVYVHDLLLHKTMLVDADNYGTALDPVEPGPASVSAGAQYVVFEALERIANPGPIRHSQSFTRNVQTGVTELNSAPRAETSSVTGNGWTTSIPSISANGQFVTFTSQASNLTTNDTNFNQDVFLRDLLTGKTTLVSVNTNGVAANGSSSDPSISADGRFVAFASTANDLVSDDTNAFRDIFVCDTQSGVVSRASVSTGGVSGNATSFEPRISPDGGSVVFHSMASTLGGSISTTSRTNLFRRDLRTGVTSALTTAGYDAEVFSQDGRFLLFRSTTGYLFDTVSGSWVWTNSFSYRPVALSSDGNRFAINFSTSLTIQQRAPNKSITVGFCNLYPRAAVRFSADNEYITYASSFSQDVPGVSDTNNTYDVYLYHIASGAKTLVSRAFNNTSAANGPSDFAAVSYDGRFVAYRSAATDLVPGDTNGRTDVFIYDRLSGSNTLLSSDISPGPKALWVCSGPVFSQNGRSLFFRSWAPDLIERDYNQTGDIFSFAFLYTSMTRLPGELPVLSWPATPGANYAVEFKSRLSDAIWLPLTGSITVTNGTASLRDTSASAQQRIYRVIGF